MDLQFKEYLEFSSSMVVGESCLDLARQGVTKSKVYDLDLDGVNRGEIPIKAHCTFPDGVTTIGQDQDIEVTQCSSPNCISHEINYNSTMMNQMIALIQSSTECFQKIDFNCLSAPLIESVSGK